MKQHLRFPGFMKLLMNKAKQLEENKFAATRKTANRVLMVGSILAGLYSADATAQNCTPPSVGCTSTDFSNSFLNASDPSTIEYDNFVATLHSSMVREADGTVLIWGENMNANGTTDGLLPKELNATNFPLLTGQILKFTGGSEETDQCQFAVLTTTGLFIWGKPGRLVATGVKSTDAFAKVTIDGKTDGLPPGVSPADVKMLFGSYKTLAITTCDGNVWMLSGAGSKYGNGLSESTTNAKKWHRVKTSSSVYLTDVIVARGVKDGMVALKSDGTLWTWGAITYLGDGSNYASRSYATQMTLPTGVVPKMIGMSIWGNSSYGVSRTNYYLLSTDGALYSLGDNNDRQLGNFTTIESKSWVRVKKSATAGDYLEDVVWISPQEHDRWYSASINVLTSTGDLWAWGYNGWNSLGFSVDGAKNPTLRPGGLSSTDKIIAVETGGHTTMVVKQCSGKYGYVGHRINGSMGDGIAAEDEEPVYNFTETAVLDLCAAPAVASFATPENSVVCPGTPFTVMANSDGTFSIIGTNATIGATSGVLDITGEGPVTVVYASGLAACLTTDTIVLQQRDFGNLDPNVYPIASATTLSSDKAWLGIDEATVDCGTEMSDGADGLSILLDGTPVSGSGTAAAPWLLTGSVAYDVELTVNGSGTSKPVYWAVWYDVNGNGDFTDTEDIFQTGNTIHGSPVSHSFGITIPVTGTATGATQGAVRIVATAVNTTFTKEMNGTVAIVNGEVEDYYISYATPLPVSLLYFNAVKDNNTVNLQWATSSEQSNKGFDIERSIDGRNWKSIGFVNSLAETGNSNMRLDYEFTDKHPSTGQNYYRLKQIYFDGGYEYSMARVVYFGKESNIVIYPNPAKDFVTISGLKGGESIKIYDAIGSMHFEQKATNTSMNISLDGLNIGVYYVRIIGIDGSIESMKIVKAK